MNKCPDSCILTLTYDQTQLLGLRPWALVEYVSSCEEGDWGASSLRFVSLGGLLAALGLRLLTFNVVELPKPLKMHLN